MARDRWTCQYCGATQSPKELTFDHVVPRAQGGRTCWENIVTCCAPCNGRKADRTPAQAGMRLRSRPRRPDAMVILTLTLARDPMPPPWRLYCWAKG